MILHTMDDPRAAKNTKAVDGIEIREATNGDNDALLALTKATPMGGRIALRIDRDPDFFALLRARGDAVVYVATHNQDVIGCLSAAIHSSYVCGTLERIAHVGDMKVHPNFRGRRVTLRLIAALQVHLQSEGVDVCFSLVADGNKPVMTIAEGKHGTPAEVQLGRFFVEELIPSPFRRRSRRYLIEPACEQDLPEITTILDGLSRKMNFAPPVRSDDLHRLIEPDRIGCFSQHACGARSRKGRRNPYRGRYEHPAPECVDRIADFSSDCGCGSSRAGAPHSRTQCAPHRQPTLHALCAIHWLHGRLRRSTAPADCRSEGSGLSL